MERLWMFGTAGEKLLADINALFSDFQQCGNNHMKAIAIMAKQTEVTPAPERMDVVDLREIIWYEC